MAASPFPYGRNGVKVVILIMSSRSCIIYLAIIKYEVSTLSFLNVIKIPFMCGKPILRSTLELLEPFVELIVRFYFSSKFLGSEKIDQNIPSNKH